MPRERFKTLTEQMFYILLCLHEECRGVDILEMVRTLTNGRVNIGSGTLYDLLEQFLKEGAIKETKAEGRRRSYIITEKGQQMLDKEYNRLLGQVADYDRALRKGASL
nr:PadR family transcriptional regulator [uncultured Oscillibacter sp.]